MAQRVHIVLEDDLDGSEAAETVRFGLDGVNFELDLSSKNAAKLRDALALYIASARKSSSRGARRTVGRGRSSEGPSASQVREWARGEGYQVSDRGRVPADVRSAYDAAH